MPTRKQKVLFVEGSEDMQLMVQTAVGKVCELTCVKTLAEGERALAGDHFSLLLMDVILADGSGFDFCEKLRSGISHRGLSIIFLTGESEIERRVRGFDVGADDYILKPFEPQEFVARIVSRLKRSRLDTAQIFSKHGFHIDLARQKAMLSDQRLELDLTPIEFKLLVHFIRNEAKIMPREELLAAVWGDTVHVSVHTIDTHISSLRKKVGGRGSCFKAVLKKGYCFIAAKASSRVS